MEHRPVAIRMVLAGALCLFGCCAVPLFHEALGDTELKAPTYCLKKAEDESCKGPECKRATKEACYHGDCSDNGECVCDACWAGPSCNELGNLHAPAFAQSLYEEYISHDQPSEYPFMHVQATDADSVACGASTVCPCAEVVHSLVDDGQVGPGGANYSPFTIHAARGSISVVAGATLVPGSKHSLRVYAENPAGSGSVGMGVVSLVVYVSAAAPADGDGQQIKLRKLQAAPEDPSLDISFVPTDESMYIGTLSLGTRVDCVLTIDIPESLQVEDVKVEIFTEDDNGTLAVVCPPTLTTGDELEVTSTSLEPAQSYYVDGNPFLIDTAVFTFGNVSNQNSSTAPEASQIVITFAIVMHEAMSLGANERYWVSAGVDYNGQTRLWVGQIGFLVNQEPQYPSTTNLTMNGPVNFYKGEVEVFNLDLNVYRRNSNLTVQAEAGSTVLANLLICELQLCSTGAGFCLDADLDLATFTVDQASQNIYDSLFRFGSIVNGGAANSTLDSRISMDIVAFLRDEDTVTAETSYDMTVTADDGHEEAQDTVSFTAKTGRTSYITPGRTLDMNVTTVDGDDQLVPGESVKVRLALMVPASTAVSNVRLTLEGTNAGFEICAARVNYVGGDMSCVTQRQDAIHATFALSDGPVATVTLGGIANTGSESTADGISNVIGVDFIVKSNLIDLADHNTQHTFTATVEGQTPALFNTISLTSITDPAVIDYPTAPIDSGVISATFDLMEPALLPQLAQSEFILLVVRPLIEPDTMYRFTVSGLLNTTDATILDMRTIRVGEHISCGLLEEPVATFFDGPDGTTKNMAELSLGLVYNFAQPGTQVTEKDTIDIMLTLKAMEDAAEGDFAVAASLLVGATRLWVAEGNITVSASVSQAPTLPTNNSLALKPDYQKEMVPGTKVVAVHTLAIPSNSSYKFVVNYTTTAFWLEVVGVNVTSLGDQLLCSSEGVQSPDYSVLEDGMSAVIDLGYVCNVPIITNTTEDDSTVLVEVTLYAINSSELEVGAMAHLLASVTVSNILEEELQDTTSLLLAVALPATTFKLCCPESAFFMVPGEVDRCNITLDLLDKALTIRLELGLPFNGTAAMSLLGVTLGAVGLNVELGATEFRLVSSDNTTQKDRASLDFGEVRNKEIHTEELGNLVDGDNTIVVYIDFQMADSEGNVNGTENVLEAGVGVSHGIIVWVAYYKLTVFREGPEHPSINVSFTHNSTQEKHFVGDTVWYHLDLNHSSESNAEAIDLSGHIFLPPYVQFQEFVPDYEQSALQPTVSHHADTTGFYFSVPSIFFTDRIAFSIRTVIRTDYQYKMTKDWRGTTPMELVFYMNHYDTNHYIVNQYFSEPMEYVTFDFNVPYPEIPDPDPVTPCGAPTAQGMASSAITDCQITASYSPDLSAAASHARLNGPSAWKTQARAGPLLYDRWIKVDLGKKTTVTAVQTQGGSSAAATGDLGEFEVLYSTDDILYKAATPDDNKVFDHQKGLPADHNTVVTHSFLAPVTARYVLLNLTAYDYGAASKWYNALRMEILGCVDGTPASDICPTESTPAVPRQYDRGFLADVSTDTLFVCDSLTHGQSGMRKELQDSVYTIQWKPQDIRCFMMVYAEKHWTGLDPRLHNIFGMLPATGRVYGLMSNSPDAYAASDPPYAVWFLTQDSDYNDAAADPSFVQAVPVPLLSDPATGFAYGSPDDYARSGYAISDWKATMSGIYKGAEKVLDWNECCQPTCAASGGDDDCM